MALGATIRAQVENGPTRMVTGSNTCPWQTIIDAGGLDDVDLATIINPTTTIILATRHILSRVAGEGTTLLLRAAYDRTHTTITANPVVKVFGRCAKAPGDPQAGVMTAWELLPNASGAINATLTCDLTNDVDDGTYKRTLCVAASHSWDCRGADEILVGVEIAIAGATGNIALAFLEGKIV